MGLVLAGIFLGYQLRRVLFRPLKGLLVLMFEQRRQVFTIRRTLVLVAILAVLVAPWTYQTRVRVDAQFAFVPTTRLEVRATESGLIEKILVREGDTVKVGQPLAILRNDELELQADVVTANIAVIDAKLAQLRQLARPEELELARRQAASARSAVKLDSYRAEQAAALESSGVGTGRDAARASGAAAVTRSMSNVAAWKLAVVQAGSRPEAIAAAESDREQLKAQLEHVQTSRDLLTLRSPIDGVVATKHLDDRISSRLARGDVLLDVVDPSSFYAEIQLDPSAPLSELEIGDRIVLAPFGTPDFEVECAVLRVRTVGNPQKRNYVVVTTEFQPPLRVVGMTGRARIYGRAHSLAYAELYLPIARVFSVELWSMVM
jgi:multidrug resistance efflux pump